MTASLAADLDLLLSAAAEAGTLALSYFGRDQRTWLKEGDSIVGEADIAVDRLLAERLLAERPGYGWLSEESADDAARLARERIFVVDPIDGTRAFVAGRREWVVSLAVVEAGRPIVAALVAPALGRTFAATAGGGATLDGRLLLASPRARLDGARFASSRRYAREPGEAAGDVRYVPSLAYRLALVAAGEVDVAIARAGARDWDLAAADLLVHEAGARLGDLAGRVLRYNRAETAHPPLVAAPPALFDAAAALVRRVDARPDGVR